MTIADTIGALAGLDPQRSEELRGHRPDATRAAEQSLHALFDVPEHDEAPGLGRAIRLLAAARAAHVDHSKEVEEFYAEQLGEEPDDPRISIDLAVQLVKGGAESEAARSAGRDIRALLRHTDLLTQRPAAATPDDLDSLLAAGWTVSEIVVLAQVVTFVSYQTRAVHGLRVLQGGAR